MLSVAIVDDNENFRKEMVSFLSKFQAEEKVEICTFEFENGMQILLDYKNQYDVIFLDIEMPMLNGMEIAKSIRKQDENVKIIFITRMANYAINGYEVNAVDFIVKPLSYFDFAFKFKKCISLINKDNSKKDKIFIKDGDSLKSVSISDILYIEVYNHTIIYHLLNEEIETRGSLSKIEEDLKEYPFARSSASQLVNIDKIKKVNSDTILLVDGEKLSLSRLKKKDFLQTILKK